MRIRSQLTVRWLQACCGLMLCVCLATQVQGAASGPPLLVEQAKLTASDAAAAARFGNSVALSPDGTQALIGAYFDDCSAGIGCGAVYVFERQQGSWVEQQKLVASDAVQNKFFGVSVSLSADGSTAIIGASRSAYIFVRVKEIWLEQQKLTSSDMEPIAAFGNAVALSANGSTVLIGAHFASCSAGGFCGAAYVFERDNATWVEQEKLTASDAAADSTFGNAVALSADGKRALIGARGVGCSTGLSCGAVYVFERQRRAWAEQQKITASDATEGDFFGDSVALSARANTALIGAGNAGCCGAAYVFQRKKGTWTEQQKLTASDAGDDSFGVSVALSERGETALIGAFGKDCSTGGFACGAAYVFERRKKGSWIEQQKLTAADAATEAVFGNSVALSRRGTTALIGAQQAACSTGGFACGAAYVFGR